MTRKISPWWFAFFIALFCGGIISLFVSGSPDGLERVAMNQGFFGSAIQFFEGVLPNYAVPGLSNTTLAQMIAGFIGTIVVFGVLYAIAWIINHIHPTGRTEK
ncbi:MAG: hypothetical protein COT25_02575 [Candidatus Kerfeldbacteria bacterium CG08_land_8_20_14_0_20_42_7]|uniref:PDGLE domain-containing protein n=1 Tax=Candidatus Kerfeldbacteria bacterium CG08_land_8_20_14_0_20_42_7 TaxID=2014245 RepID=A0A2H0YTD5_9BACT|nr:MAG: hypothetical protein COT25_02575 [Candidatus Kerfeldbacteria bacterium CG08_land_8_20_14_0_20_42_7]